MADTGNKMTLTFVILVSVVLLLPVMAKYKMSEIDIKINYGDVPAMRFTPAQIKRYDGSDDRKPLYMAVRGVVFDVTEGKDFYGKGGAYHALTGKDASRAIALWSLEEKDMKHDLTGLSDSELKSLDEVYQGTYMKKYHVVGYMDYLLDEHLDDTFEERYTHEEL